MPQESTTPDLVELTRQVCEAANRHDLDAAMSFSAPDAVFDMRELGVSRAGRREDWFRAYEDYQIEVEEILDLGNGVTFAVIVQTGRLVGSRGEIRVRQAVTQVWAQGAIVHTTNGTDVEEDRAAAERLAESRG